MTWVLNDALVTGPAIFDRDEIFFASSLQFSFSGFKVKIPESQNPNSKLCNMSFH